MTSTTPSSTPRPSTSSAAAMQSPSGDFDRVAELFIALSTRWRSPTGALGIGVPRPRLVEILGEADLTTALDQLCGRLHGLGLELVEYRFEGQHWLCLRALHVAPSELSEDEQGVLGAIMMLLQRESEATTTPATEGTPATPPKPRRRRRSLDGDLATMPVSKLYDVLVGSGGVGAYLSRSRLDDVLKHLEFTGYIVRRGRQLSFGPRCLIEFPDDAREQIAEQASRLIS